MYKMDKYVKKFKKNNCNGSVEKGNHFVIKDGKCKIMISAPHAVNHYREGAIKYADINTGVIANVLHDQCGCPIIYTCGYKEADANWDEPDVCAYKQALKNYIAENDIKLLIDIHGTKESSNLAFEFGTVDQNDKSLQGFGFVGELFRICFEKHISDFCGKTIGKNIVFSASKSSTITNYISTVCGIPCIQIEINKLFREGNGCLQTIDAFICAINALKVVEWNSKDIRVYKAGRSNSLFPLYKAEIASLAGCRSGDIMMACSEQNSSVDVECFEKNDARKDVIYLTNRLIKILFKEDNDFEGKPIILYSTHMERMPVGKPAAERLEICASPELFDDISTDDTHDFVLYNRFTKTKMFFTPRKYYDIKGKKVMLSYYYRRLMGLELPIKEIEKDGMEVILDKLDEQDREVIKNNYHITEDGIYELAHEISTEDKELIKKIEEKAELNKLELLKYPKEKVRGSKRGALARKMIDSVLEIYIGSRTMEFRACRSTHPVDDQLMIVRMSRDMMNLLGVDENDYVWVKYGNERISLKVFEGNISSDMVHVQEDEVDMMISVPALARQQLKMLNINNVVSVSRDMRYCLKRHISRQIFTILGTFLTIFTLSEAPVFRIICGIVAVPIILYFDFSEERVLVKYKEKE